MPHNEKQTNQTYSIIYSANLNKNRANQSTLSSGDE